MILADFTKSHSLSTSATFLWLDEISCTEHIDPTGALTLPPAFTLPSANGGGNSSSLIMGGCCAAAASAAATAADSLWKCGRHGRAKRSPSVHPPVRSPTPPPLSPPLSPPRWSVRLFRCCRNSFLGSSSPSSVQLAMSFPPHLLPSPSHHRFL